MNDVGTPGVVAHADWSTCRPCNCNFATFTEYHNHKVDSPRHITCMNCSMDFLSREGLKAHRLQNHPHKQNLYCERCYRHFTRAGALVSHIELEGCNGATVREPSTFIAGVKQKTKKYQNMGNVRNYVDFGRTAGNFSPEPMPQFTDYSIAVDPYLPSSNVNLNSQEGVGPLIDISDVEERVVANNEDLISFDASARILNADWDAPTTKISQIPYHDHISGFPALNSQVIPGLNSVNAPTLYLGNVWAHKQTPATATAASRSSQPPISQSTPWALGKPKVENVPITAPLVNVDGNTAWDYVPQKQNIAPAITQAPYITQPFQHLTVQDGTVEPVLSPHDPKYPGFKVSNYYIPLLEKYKCPHNGCKKTHTSEPAFIQHLYSPAHRKENLQCLNCLRYFQTATALTQHSEAQGVKCKVRNTEQYHAEVDRFTAGHLGLGGKHVDDTVKYVNTATANTMGIVAAHRAVGAANEEKRKTYWDRHQPDW